MAEHWRKRVKSQSPGDADPNAESKARADSTVPAGASAPAHDDGTPVEAAVEAAVETLGSAIAKSTLNAVDALFGPSKLPDARRQMADHFWCDLFAALAEAIEKFNDTLESVPDCVVDIILGSEKQARRSLITHEVVKLAVKKAWSPVEAAIKASFQSEDVLRALRILAVLACPAPEKHIAVRRHCLKPLGSEMLTEATKDRLEVIFPEEFTAGM
ncbi:MAG: hypothetical protein AB7V44_00825 [Pseudonocardia sp.]